jgi:Hexameric tyrosine-coordinated heme protein (HTHP)
MDTDELWLPTLKTDTPQAGIELAVKLSDLGFMLFESSEDRRELLRTTDKYTRTQLIAAAHVIALNFQTVAAANDWWRHRTSRNGD